MFGGIGMAELMIIMLVVLIFFGPKKIPELARGLGKGLSELRRAAEDVKQELDIDNFDQPKIDYKKQNNTYDFHGSDDKDLK